MRLNDEIKELLNAWRPALGNVTDLDILRLVQGPNGTKDQEKERRNCILSLLKKRMKEGAIKKSFKDKQL